MNELKYSSPLHEKLFNKPAFSTEVNLCVWSDLLGFGAHFTKNNWDLSYEDWQIITERLDDFYKIHCQYFSSIFREYMFVLNDGVIRSYFPSKASQETALYVLLDIELWLRNIIISHITICEVENAKNCAGVRTVIAFGEKANYTFSEVRIDDFVMNYSRPDGGYSRLAQLTGNPAVINNPVHLQMNTALAKAYIIESFGSKKGISGASLYVDESVLIFLKQLAGMTDKVTIDIKNTDDGELISFEYTETFERPWLFGLLLSEAIIVNDEKIFTKVYKLLAFYPSDEHPDKFKYVLK